MTLTTVGPPEEVRWINEGKIHRGYTDHSGLFTLEECQKDQAGEIDVLSASAELPEGDLCEHCFDA